MFDGKYNFNQLAPKLNNAFGVSDKRTAEIFKKLYSVVKIYPSYIAVCEVWLNCEKFTEMEKAFGLFVMGKVFGINALRKRARIIRVVYPEGDLEGKLVKLLYEGTRTLNHYTEQTLKFGKN